jgi:hypothetical protein
MTGLLFLLLHFSPAVAQAASAEDAAQKFCTGLLRLAAKAPKPSPEAFPGDTSAKLQQFMQLRTAMAGLDVKAKAAIREKKDFAEFVAQQKQLGTVVPAPYEAFYIQAYEHEWCGDSSGTVDRTVVGDSTTVKTEIRFEKTPSPAEHSYADEANKAADAK